MLSQIDTSTNLDRLTADQTQADPNATQLPLALLMIIARFLTGSDYLHKFCLLSTKCRQAKPLHTDFKLKLKQPPIPELLCRFSKLYVDLTRTPTLLATILAINLKNPEITFELRAHSTCLSKLSHLPLTYLCTGLSTALEVWPARTCFNFYVDRVNKMPSQMEITSAQVEFDNYDHVEQPA